MSDALVSRLEERSADLRTWLFENAPDCDEEQRHLDEGTAERAYWHYGYAVAVKDVLQLLASSPNGSGKAAV